ncbi:MAG: hypothetical protein NC453_12190 [Muribaculum sp.]|nr:hypothetical protein [Muribaculum sp.]
MLYNKKRKIEYMIFKTIQYISAKYPVVHKYLKSIGYNKQENFFFIDNTGMVVYMLTQQARLYKIYQWCNEPGMESLNNNVLMSAAINQARKEVAENHPYLKAGLESIESKLNIIERTGLF